VTCFNWGDVSATSRESYLITAEESYHSLHAVAFYNIVVESHISRMADQNEEGFYIKGYKVDRDKILNNFPTRPDDPENLRMIWLWKQFPTEFLYLGIGKEPDGKTSLVVVLAEGADKEKLEQETMVDLSEPYTKVFTPGIWVKDD
jgi:hypothetical protein